MMMMIKLKGTWGWRGKDFGPESTMPHLEQQSTGQNRNRKGLSGLTARNFRARFFSCFPPPPAVGVLRGLGAGLLAPPPPIPPPPGPARAPTAGESNHGGRSWGQRGASPPPIPSAPPPRSPAWRGRGGPPPYLGLVVVDGVLVGDLVPDRRHHVLRLRGEGIRTPPNTTSAESFALAITVTTPPSPPPSPKLTHPPKKVQPLYSFHARIEAHPQVPKKKLSK